jgi:hypothetical protein
LFWSGIKVTTAEEMLSQLDRERRTVSYDAYDIIVRQLVDMVKTDAINIAPEYQRQFIWKEKNESELVESILLGIPVPSLFMAVNATDGSWEVVDGVQRLSTILHFVGDQELLTLIGRSAPLQLADLSKLTAFNGVKFDSLPSSIKAGFLNRPLRVTTLNDRSNYDVRFDLFERLNTGGVKLHSQEIRSIVYRGEFKNIIRQLSVRDDFRSALRLRDDERIAGAEYEEAVLRFFAFLDRYREFDHIVRDFLNAYMRDHARTGPGAEAVTLFNQSFEFMRRELPNGIVRGRQATPINLYEAIAVGTALAMRATGGSPRMGVLANLLNDERLKQWTTAGTNTRRNVTNRIECVRDALV